MHKYFIPFYALGLFQCMLITLLFRYMDIDFLFIHLSVDGHLGCFELWVIMNNTAINTHIKVVCVCVCVCIYVFIYLGCGLRSEIAQSYGNPGLKHLTHCQTMFLSDYNILHSCQFCMRVLLSSYLCLHLLLSAFFCLVMLVLPLGESVLCEWRSQSLDSPQENLCGLCA